MKIAIGFITYNVDTAKYLPYFLDSLFKSLDHFEKDDCLVIARDNSDEVNNYNREYIEDVFNKTEKLINFSWSGENAGFSKSYNQMILESAYWGAEIFFMVNPDTVLAPDSLKKMVDVLNSDNFLGSVAPKILRWDFANKKLSNQIDTCGLSLNPGLVFTDIGQGMIDNGQFQNFPILGPSGAAALYKMTALDKIKKNNHFLDERMFMYKEDCDLAYRLFLEGFSSRLVPDALIYHDRSVAAKGSGLFSSLGNRSNKSREVRSWSFLNQHLLIIKFWSKQNFRNKLNILLRIVLFGIYALFFEPFLLKNYSKISQYLKEERLLQKAID